jgi:hypothetical protein
MPKVEPATKPNGKTPPRTTLVKKKEKTPVYPEVDVLIKRGKDALTMKEAMQLVGWTTDPEAAREHDAGEWLFVDTNAKQVWGLNNLHNRRFVEPWMRTISQDVLDAHWRFNGETIIIGRYGSVLSGQHRLFGFIMACLRWKSEAEHVHWEDKWPDEPTLECIIVRGIDESDDVTKTLDNVRPRTLGDVLFVGGEFADATGKDKDAMTRMTDAAIKLLWLRTGRGVDQYSPRRTHSGSLDFLARHPRVKEAVRHVHEQNKDNRIGKLVGPGSAAALLYLMGVSKSDGEEYHASEEPGEKHLDFGYWDKAKDFWTLLAMPNSELKDVRLSRRPVQGDEVPANKWSGYVFGSTVSGLNERIACLVKAWGQFLTGEKVTLGSVRLTYNITENDVAENGVATVYSADLMETPKFGGIDLGDVKKSVRKAKVKTDETPAADTGNGKPAPEGTGGVDTDQVGADEAQRELDVMKSLNPGRLIVLKIKNGYGVFGQDALEAARVLKLKARTSSNSLPSIGWDEKNHPGCLGELTASGLKVAVCRRVPAGKGKTKVESERHDPPATPTVKANVNKKVKVSK